MTAGNEAPLSSGDQTKTTTMNEETATTSALAIDSTADVSDTCKFSMGDHVYQWCSVAFIPGIYQHHGIVLDTYRIEDQWMLKIVDFSNDENYGSHKSKKYSSMSGSSNGTGTVRTYVSSANDWHAVVYHAGMWKRTLQRAGTCTAVRADPPGLVRARAQYLLEHPEILPKYDAVKSNCECVAVWCKTGTFATLQASSWLSITAAGQVKSAVTVGGVAAATQVSVPSAGLWGWLGYTTHVSLLTAQPMLIPAIATYGIVTAGVPAVVLAMATHCWKKATSRLNDSFWEHAIEQPDVFVECITYWSGSHDPLTSEVTELQGVKNGGDDEKKDPDALVYDEAAISAAHTEATSSLFSTDGLQTEDTDKVAVETAGNQRVDMQVQGQADPSQVAELAKSNDLLPSAQTSGQTSSQSLTEG